MMLRRAAVTLGVLSVAACEILSAGPSRTPALHAGHLESPAPFDPAGSGVDLSATVGVTGLSADAFTLRAEFRINQGGGIPVRTLDLEKRVASEGDVALDVHWDGTDASGARVRADVYEVVLTLSLVDRRGATVAAVSGPDAPALSECALGGLCGVVRACAAANTDPERCDPPLGQSHYVCSVLGGYAGPAPLSSWNFRGTGDPGPIRLPYALDATDRYGANAPPGGNPNDSENPIVAGSDLGSPVEYTSAGGSKKLVFLFGDTSPLAAYSYLHDASGTLVPSGSPFGQNPSNDDVLATSTQSDDDPPTGPERCLDLSFEHGPDVVDPVQQIPQSQLIAPITMDGPFEFDAASGFSGIDLGYTRVPGPAFSVAHRLFALMPSENDPSVGIGCDAAHPCAGGDACIAGACFYGDCSALDGTTACFKRNGAATIAVSDAGDGKFRSLTAAEHAPGALEVYRGRADIIPPLAFYVPDDAEVYVFGRDRIVGHASAYSELELWKHAVSPATGIGAPEFFAGCDDAPGVCDSPRFSGTESDAVPVYAEDRLIVNQTSVSYFPSFGLWVMIYGGRLPTWTRNIYPSLQTSDLIDPYAGVVLRTAKHPWGPWSSAETLYNPYWTNVDGYCELMFRTDAQVAMLDQRVGDGFSSLGCDPHTPVQSNTKRPPDEFGAEYGVAIVPRFFRDSPDELSFFWLMSTWNPYRVVLMQSTLKKPPN